MSCYTIGTGIVFIYMGSGMTLEVTGFLKCLLTPCAQEWFFTYMGSV